MNVSFLFTPEYAIKELEKCIASLQNNGGEELFAVIDNLLDRIKKYIQDEKWLMCYAYALRRQWNLMSGTSITDVPSPKDVDALMKEHCIDDPMLRRELTKEYSEDEEVKQLEKLALTPEKYCAQLRADGITDNYELAARMDAYFIDNRRLSNAQLGKLLPARPGTTIGPHGMRSRGRRLRNKNNHIAL